MHSFEFHNPTRVIFGRGTVPQVGAAIAREGVHTLLLIGGEGSIRENGVYQAVVQSLSAAGITATEAWGVRPNPELTLARELVHVAQEHQVEGVLAIGGGSVIDTAKCVAAGVYVDDLWSCFERTCRIERALPIFAVLTISASGSEMDQWAVLTQSDQHRKWAISSPVLYPRVAIVDPSVQTSLPWRQTVNGAIAVLSHIMASYLVGTFEETTLALDEGLMRTVVKMVERLQADHADYGARANLAWAATLAMNGLISAGIDDSDWSAHSIESAMSALHPDVAHGAGMAVILPVWMAYVRESNPGQFQRWAKTIWDAETVEEGIMAMKAAFQRWGAPSTLSDIGIGAGELRDIAFNALAEGPIGKLRVLTVRDVVELLKLAL
ncbi:MAG: iron-containing alcohol dehydrogenase [Candidatus Cryosericum sp.]|nr:iron-containing alcohol dehydrogenase [bacterium]